MNEWNVQSIESNNGKCDGVLLNIDQSHHAINMERKINQSMPVCCLEELSGEVATKLAPVHKLLKLVSIFFLLAKSSGRREPATGLSQSSLSAISLGLCYKTCSEK